MIFVDGEWTRNIRLEDFDQFSPMFGLVIQTLDQILKYLGDLPEISSHYAKVTCLSCVQLPLHDDVTRLRPALKLDIFDRTITTDARS